MHALHNGAVSRFTSGVCSQNVPWFFFSASYREVEKKLELESFRGLAGVRIVVYNILCVYIFCMKDIYLQYIRSLPLFPL